MNCPDCGNERTHVIDTGTSTDETTIRRHRKCHRRSLRFATPERPEWVSLDVKNRDGPVESVTRMKLRTRTERAIGKCNPSETTVTCLVDEIESVDHDRETCIVSPTFSSERVSERIHDIGTVTTSDSYQDTINSLNPKRTVANSIRPSVLKPKVSDQRQ
ncbi:NrdR family transcriptional regulator [Natrinema altunense]|uniref:Transcriptional regulator NrdR n=1 Tax=Natrinema altunense TaxID=222984 RepID=A0A482XXF1_9EURY|nr:transcriptional regulator NrdR [Natrinema altunense]